MKKKNTLLYTDDIFEQFGTVEDIMREYKASYGEDLAEENALEWANEMTSLYWTDFLNELSNIPVLLIADLGLWNGRSKGGKAGYLKDIIISATSQDSNKIEYNQEDSTIDITASHHDGTNFYKVYALSKKGEAYWQNHYYDEPRQLHEHLLKVKGYTRRLKESEVGLG